MSQQQQQQAQQQQLDNPLTSRRTDGGKKAVTRFTKIFGQSCNLYKEYSTI